ncbi:GntR family transcriptional regulator [Sphingomonas sp.]|uniref:GntR family transcriptional regulator n=1 Tax=Sphingomonas sp. TaxID=28214 RepID=UPI001B2D40B4|nr:GntR family transcriptional regulator [Sphingomonas sp.]MBO9711670.1 GntR family transcriptional regulator [Sphingomonas sp.]
MLANAIAEETTEEAPRKRGHVQDQVLNRLRRGLMIGAFVPGQVMSLRKLAAGFGTSAMPVREALRQLVAAHALEEMPNGSVRVPRLSPERIQQIFDVREAVESMAAGIACKGDGEALAERLRPINGALKTAIYKRNILGCLEYNQAFHFTIYEAAGSEVLTPIIESLWLQSGPTMYFSLISPDMPWDATAHDEVIDAIRDGDAARVKRHIARDIRATGKHLIREQVSETLSGPFASPL